MLTPGQERRIRALHIKKGRIKHGQCLVEGEHAVESAASFVEYTFSREDTPDFDELVTTETPQDIAAVARIPLFTIEDVMSSNTVLVLDNVQDPGNVGAIIRLCKAFDASLILVSSVDPTNPKTLRSSTGMIFSVPWLKVHEDDIEDVISQNSREIFRLEKRDVSQDISVIQNDKPIFLFVGSEGSGINLPINGTSVSINHSATLESINVGNAVAITLFLRSTGDR